MTKTAVTPRIKTLSEATNQLDGFVKASLQNPETCQCADEVISNETFDALFQLAWRCDFLRKTREAGFWKMQTLEVEDGDNVDQLSIIATDSQGDEVADLNFTVATKTTIKSTPKKELKNRVLVFS